MATITIKDLFDTGAHFGHKTERWHPKMKEYIYGSKNGIYILDLRKTLERLKAAHDYVYNISANGGRVLFVGTKYQAREIIADQANKSDNYYINLRWLGGMLTNFNTVKQSITKLKKFEEAAGADGTYTGVIKKEAVRMEKARRKLDSTLGGIREMRRSPNAVFIIDVKRESIALKEAKKLGIPVIAVVDSNCDPRDVDYIIPGNDDSIHCINLFTSVIAAAAIEGRKAFDKKVATEGIKPIQEEEEAEVGETEEAEE